MAQSKHICAKLTLSNNTHIFLKGIFLVNTKEVMMANQPGKEIAVEGSLGVIYVWCQKTRNRRGNTVDKIVARQGLKIDEKT